MCLRAPRKISRRENSLTQVGLKLANPSILREIHPRIMILQLLGEQKPQDLHKIPIGSYVVIASAEQYDPRPLLIINSSRSDTLCKSEQLDGGGTRKSSNSRRCWVFPLIYLPIYLF